MRIGVFGGSFDPVHLGHLLLAECSRQQGVVDRVLLVPAARQPLKPCGPIAGDQHRLAMLRLAIAGRPECDLSTVELDRGGVSYTVDTLRALRSRWPEAELLFLMGADSLAEFPKWREPRAICELATPAVVRRAGAAEPDFTALAPLVTPERLRQIAAAQIEMPPAPVSSSQIRDLIAAGGDWQSLVPSEVADYIRRHRLYGWRG